MTSNCSQSTSNSTPTFCYTKRKIFMTPTRARGAMRKTSSSSQIPYWRLIEWWECTRCTALRIHFSTRTRNLPQSCYTLKQTALLAAIIRFPNNVYFSIRRRSVKYSNSTSLEVMESQFQSRQMVRQNYKERWGWISRCQFGTWTQKHS